MDFCVKCGKKEVFQEFLCEACYEHINSRSEKKKKVKKPSKKNKEARHPSYFEAIVQLRNVQKKVVDHFLKQCELHRVTISKTVGLKQGVDFFISSNDFAQKMGKELQEKFGGLVKVSPSLFTRDRMSGKEVYRLTVLFKQFPYSKGEEFEFKGEKYWVIRTGKYVHVENAAKKKRRIRFRDLERDRVF